jgi:hypothetical protein
MEVGVDMEVEAVEVVAAVEVVVEAAAEVVVVVVDQEMVRAMVVVRVMVKDMVPDMVKETMVIFLHETQIIKPYSLSFFLGIASHYYYSNVSENKGAAID